MKLTSRIDKAINALSSDREACLADLENDFRGVKDFQNTGMTSFPEYVCVGKVCGGEFSYPALIRTDQARCLAFEKTDKNRDAVNATMESIAVRICRQMDRRYVDIRTCDPGRLGLNMRNISTLAQPDVDADAVRNAISNLCAGTERFIRNGLSSYADIVDYNARSGSIQPYRVVVLADVPLNEPDFVQRMEVVLDTAAETGVFIILGYRREKGGHYFGSVPSDELLRKTVNFRDAGDGRTFKVSNYDGGQFFNEMFRLRLEDPEELAASVRAEAARLAKASRQDVCFDIRKGYRVPIGTSYGDVRYLTFGIDTDSFHCIIAGQSGMGKTNLLNVIIARGIKMYSPDELQFILINCAGPGYQEYAGCPHVMEMRCTSSLDECVEAVDCIGSLQAEREQMYVAANATELDDYIKITGRKLPRVICIVDEFQVLYTGKQSVCNHVDDVLVKHVLKIGRKYGIHLILSTQSLGEEVSPSLLKNIRTRIALGMTERQSLTFLSEKNKAAAKLLKGEAIYNDRNGAPSGNVPLKIDYLPQEAVEEIVRNSKA